MNICIDILKKRTTDIELKKEAVRLLSEAGSLDFTMKYLKEIKQDIFDELKLFNVNPYFEQMLTGLCKLIE